MSRFYSHINTSKTILNLYKGDVPFSNFLRNFFAQEKKYGSRDRKSISSVCYNYFRLGSALKDRSIDERILAAIFLSSDVPNDFFQNERPEWNDKVNKSLDDKLRLTELDVQSIFPFNNELTSGIDTTAFNRSFLIQPDLFIRVRPGKQSQVKEKLVAAVIAFKETGENSLAFANGTKLEDVLPINRDAVIQDLNSQRVGELLQEADIAENCRVWDCCAASGGKSIMAYDLLSPIQLTVSDVRQSIIQNLRKRLQEAGIKSHRSFIADLTDAKALHSSLGNSKFDLIICDAPCSGSGTWSRTPEQLLFFKQEEITRYSNLQKNIAANTVNYLGKGSHFLYVTCSVFKKENEEVVEFIRGQLGLQLIKIKLLKGYDLKADSMFAALFKSG